MYVIDQFTTETPYCKSPWTKQFFSLVCFVTLDQIPQIKIFHTVASEHPEVIEGSRKLISTDVLDYDEAAAYGSVDNYGAALDKDYDISLV